MQLLKNLFFSVTLLSAKALYHKQFQACLGTVLFNVSIHTVVLVLLIM